MTIILGILTEGLVYAILSLGIYITYKILDFPDLSVDGTFPLGAAVSVTLIINGVSPILSILAATLVGAVFGVITGIIHVKFKIRDLISGIIVMTALYSINLRIAGKANVPLFSQETIFENDFLKSLPLGHYTDLVVLIVIVVITKVLLDFYLKTKSGLLLRAVGDNDVIVTSLAKNKGNVKILGLAIANALASMAGAVYCQLSGFFEISVGTGTVVIGLANVIIGISIARHVKFKPTTAVIIGSIIYKACVSLAIALGLAASDLKLITAGLLFLILAISNAMKKGKRVKEK